MTIDISVKKAPFLKNFGEVKLSDLNLGEFWISITSPVQLVVSPDGLKDCQYTITAKFSNEKEMAKFFDTQYASTQHNKKDKVKKVLREFLTEEDVDDITDTIYNIFK